MERRVFLGVSLAGTAAWGLWEWRAGKEEALAQAQLPVAVEIARFDDAGRETGTSVVSTVRRSDEEWKKILPVDAYMVTRRADTEFAYAGQYWDFHGDGLYRCVCCATALFDSATKFSSGTGWPSFYQVVSARNVVLRADSQFGLARTEVRCARCFGHLGHLFRDGPPPTGLRYCMNSVALRFVPRKAAQRII